MNLWSGLDSNSLLSDNARSLRHTKHARRSQQLSERPIRNTVRHWLLREYVARYCLSLSATRIFRRCYWIDALGLEASESKASEQPSEQPVRKGRRKEAPQLSIPRALQPIAELTRQLAQANGPFALLALLFTAGSSRKSRKQVKVQQLARESSILSASWLELAPLVLKEIEQSPAIFLLNPFGTTLFSADDLTPLYQRTVPTELCLLLPHKQVATHLLAALRLPEQATILTNLLRSDRWKTLPTSEEELPQAVAGLIDLFVAAMQRHFSWPVQRIPIIVQTGSALLEEAPYTLLFATRRQDSLLNMNDALCLYQRHLQQQSYVGVLSEEWFITQQRQRYEHERQQLYDRVRQQGEKLRPRRWPDLRQQMILASFGQFTSSDYDSIIQQLLLNRDVRCLWKRPSLSDQNGEEKERLPGNDDTLLWR